MEKGIGEYRLQIIKDNDEMLELLSKNLDEKNQCILLNSMSSFDIESGIPSKPYSRIDLTEQDEYIKNFLSKMKLDYEYDPEPTDEELEHLIPKAFQRFENKRKDIGFNSDTIILIKINNEKLVVLPKTKPNTLIFHR